MIILDDILLLHQFSIEDFGGAHGIRDIGMLESALTRPFQTFDGKELYPDIFRKAAAVGESLIVNHPFVDGNKRTGLLAMLTLLLANSIQIQAKGDDLYNFVIDISTGKIRFDEIVIWLKTNSVHV